MKIPKAIDPNQERYFAALEKNYSIVLTDEQKRWYVTKEKQQKDEMKREYPSVLYECFEVAVE